MHWAVSLKLFGLFGLSGQGWAGLAKMAADFEVAAARASRTRRSGDERGGAAGENGVLQSQLPGKSGSVGFGGGSQWNGAGIEVDGSGAGPHASGKRGVQIDLAGVLQGNGGGERHAKLAFRQGDIFATELQEAAADSIALTEHMDGVRLGNGSLG